MTPTTLPAIACPECLATLDVQPTLAGEILDCDGCGAELEVVRLQPIRLEVAPEIEEDWGE